MTEQLDIEGRVFDWTAERDNRRVRIRETSEGIDIALSGNLEPFLTMKKNRTARDPASILKGLTSQQGYEFANIGGSVALTLTISGDNYLAGVYQPLNETKDLIFKLVSGYIPGSTPVNGLSNPRDFLLREELSEEVVLVKSYSPGQSPKIIPFEIDGEAIIPFPDYFIALPETAELKKPSRLVLPSRKKPVTLEGAVESALDGKVLRDSPLVYYDPAVGGAQFVFDYHITPKRTELTDLSLWTIEDEFDIKGAPDKRKPMKTVGSKNKLMLIKLTPDGKLTDAIGTLDQGRFCPVDPGKINLSEFFCLDENRMATANNIPLLTYFEKQNPKP